jgi:pilus assembly protein CpaE
MLTFILAFTERETGGYLEEKIKAAAPATILATCQRMEELLALVERHRPNGLLMDISADPDGLLPLVERVVKKYPSVSVYLACQKFKCHQGLLLTAMRLGVREFFPIPFEDDLKAAVGRLTEKVSSSQESSPAARGRLACLISSKGGSGSTFIATNLAVSLFQQYRRSTALVDLNLQLGDVSLFMNLKPQSTIADLAKNIERLDGVLLLEMMTKHSTGVQVLAAPKRLEEAGLLSATHLQKAYSLLKTMFDWVVVDLPIAFDESMLATCQNADEILLVTLLNIPALRNTKRYLEIFWRLGYPRDRVRVLVNRYYRGAEGSLSPKEAEKALGHPIFHSIPNDYKAAISAINQGLPLRELVPNTPIVKAFDELARLLNSPAAGKKVPIQSPIAEERKPKRGLFGRFFRTPAEVN